MRWMAVMPAMLFAVTVAQAATVSVGEPWVRATVPGQKVTGAFMTLTADADAKLVAAKSPLAARVEVHEMKMDGGVMKMREVPAIDLPRGTPVKLEPGGYHLMLMGLVRPLAAGSVVPIELVVESAGKPHTVKVNAPVRAVGGRPASGGHAHH